MGDNNEIPLDLAVCRWFAVEAKVLCMPMCIFYPVNSPSIQDKYIRIALCRGLTYTQTAFEKLGAYFENYRPKTALIIVDVQKDFFEGGALEVKDAH